MMAATIASSTPPMTSCHAVNSSSGIGRPQRFSSTPPSASDTAAIRPATVPIGSSTILPPVSRIITPMAPRTTLARRSKVGRSPSSGHAINTVMIGPSDCSVPATPPGRRSAAMNRKAKTMPQFSVPSSATLAHHARGGTWL